MKILKLSFVLRFTSYSILISNRSSYGLSRTLTTLYNSVLGRKCSIYEWLHAIMSQLSTPYSICILLQSSISTASAEQTSGQWSCSQASRLSLAVSRKSGGAANCVPRTRERVSVLSRLRRLLSRLRRAHECARPGARPTEKRACWQTRKMIAAPSNL